MYLIFGLGNIGTEYVATRHNAGFDVIDAVADKANIDVNKEKFKALVGEGFLNNKKIVLVKPTTYMNNSGESVVMATNFYKPNDDELIVIYDDITIPPGSIRIRKKGSAGGHNGIKSIIALTGNENFHRIKVGVGQPKHDLVSHVLGKFNDDEIKDYQKGQALALEAVETILKNGIDEAMNKYNSSGKEIKNDIMAKRRNRVKEAMEKTNEKDSESVKEKKEKTIEIVKENNHYEN